MYSNIFVVDCSTDHSEVGINNSGFSGVSNGELIPVNSEISPARAFL
jgi:hypothetical protein